MAKASQRCFRNDIVPTVSAKAHKNLDFVLGKPENGGSGRQKRTKTSILCSKGSKTRVRKAKKAQKPRFCARKARKWGFRRAKAHKNADFVLERPGIGTGKRGNWHREAQPLPSSKPPRTAMKVNSLVMRYLHFGSVRGDFLERRTGQVAVLTGTQHLRHCLGRELPTLCREKSAPSSLWRRQE